MKSHPATAAYLEAMAIAWVRQVQLCQRLDTEDLDALHREMLAKQTDWALSMLADVIVQMGRVKP